MRGYLGNKIEADGSCIRVKAVYFAIMTNRLYISVILLFYCCYIYHVKKLKYCIKMLPYLSSTTEVNAKICVWTEHSSTVFSSGHKLAEWSYFRTCQIHK